MPEPAAAPTDWPDLVDAEESSDDEGIPPLLPDSPTSPGPSLVYSWSWANSPRARVGGGPGSDEQPAPALQHPPTPSQHPPACLPCCTSPRHRNLSPS